jgi:hypothetical protein
MGHIRHIMPIQLVLQKNPIHATLSVASKLPKVFMPTAALRDLHTGVVRHYDL